MWAKRRRLTPVAALAPGGGGGSYDPATIAWVNAVVTAGGTVSTTQEGYVDTLIKSLKSNSLFSILDRLWLLASENVHQAQIDIINLGTWTSHGTITFSANNGYTGDGSTGYLDTGFTPNIAGGNYAQNSSTIGAYVLTSRTANQTYVEIGATNQTGPAYAYIQPLASGAAQYEMNGNTFPNATNGNARGHWLNTRTSSSAVALYKNGSSVGSSSSDTSTSAPGTSILISAFHDFSGGSYVVDDFSADQIAAAYFGAGMNATQVANLDTALNGGYMTSLGINVH